MGLQKVSKRAEEIYENTRERIMRNKDQCSSGLLEQYEILLARLKSGAPGCELISFPGLLSGPSMTFSFANWLNYV
jgi:hypothetical protein